MSSKNRKRQHAYMKGDTDHERGKPRQNPSKRVPLPAAAVDRDFVREYQECKETLDEQLAELYREWKAGEISGEDYDKYVAEAEEDYTRCRRRVDFAHDHGHTQDS